MSNVAYFINSRPIVATLPAYALPISLSDMQTAHPNLNAPGVSDAMTGVIYSQQNLSLLTPATPAYVAQFNAMSSLLRSIGLYPTGAQVGPAPTAQG